MLHLSYESVSHMIKFRRKPTFLTAEKLHFYTTIYIYASLRKDINHRPFAGVSQYALKFFPICISLELINGNHIRKGIAGIAHMVKNSGNSGRGDVCTDTNFLHGLNLGKLINDKSPDSLSSSLILRHKGNMFVKSLTACRAYMPSLMDFKDYFLIE